MNAVECLRTRSAPDWEAGPVCQPMPLRAVQQGNVADLPAVLIAPPSYPPAGSQRWPPGENGAGREAPSQLLLWLDLTAHQ